MASCVAVSCAALTGAAVAAPAAPQLLSRVSSHTSGASVLRLRGALPSSGSSSSCSSSCSSRAMTRRQGHVVCMAGGGGGVEPDLSEEKRETWRTAGEDAQEDDTYPYGKVDGAHAYHDGDDGEAWPNVQKAIEAAGGPSSPGQKAIAWLFLPAFFTLVALGQPPEYYMAFTVLFIFAYVGIEMGKPTKPSNFEPDMYKIK